VAAEGTINLLGHGSLPALFEQEDQNVKASKDLGRILVYRY